MSKQLSLITIVSLILVVGVSAQTPSPSSIRDAVKEQVAKELSDIKLAVAKKGYVGSVSAKSDLSLTITNLTNKPRTATVTADSAIKLLNGRDGTPADVKVGDFVIAMGDSDSSGNLSTTRLLIIKQPSADSRDSVYGTVTKVTGSTFTVENLKKESWTVKTSSTTKYTGTTKAVDVKVDSKIVAAGSVPTDKSLTAGFIHLVGAK